LLPAAARPGPIGGRLFYENNPVVSAPSDSRANNFYLYGY